MRNFRINDVVQHFKGNLYRILHLAEHTETGQLLVVYKSMRTYETKVYVRPYDMFMTEVDKEKYPNTTQKYRFEKVSE